MVDKTTRSDKWYMQRLPGRAAQPKNEPSKANQQQCRPRLRSRFNSLSYYQTILFSTNLDGRQKQQTTNCIHRGYSAGQRCLKTNLASRSVGRGLGCVQLVDAVEGLSEAAVHVEPPVADEELLVENWYEL